MGGIRELLRVPPESEALVRGFFTEQAPPLTPTTRASECAGVILGTRAFFCGVLQGVSILLDPVLSYTYESSIFAITACSFDLPDHIDYVLITHGHPDHVLFETLSQLRHKIRTILVPRNGDGLAGPSLKLLLENCEIQECNRNQRNARSPRRQSMHHRSPISWENMPI